MSRIDGLDDMILILIPQVPKNGEMYGQMVTLNSPLVIESFIA
jgi:hypothetical protein